MQVYSLVVSHIYFFDLCKRKREKKRESQKLDDLRHFFFFFFFSKSRVKESQNRNLSKGAELWFHRIRNSRSFTISAVAFQVVTTSVEFLAFLLFNLSQVIKAGKQTRSC